VTPDPFSLVGTVIADKFRVERVLGEGGFGVVYAGTHLVLGLPVAIKCLKTGDPAAFLREARILFTLTHPAIVRLFDAGVVPGRNIPYAALELLTGPTLLDDIEKRAPMKRQYGREEIAAIFGTILEGVAHAHEHGIVHRDLKPSNIMLVGDAVKPHPKVLDFGTARDAVAALDTMNAASLGSGFTPLYAAPEQWDRARGQVSPRTDVYALGVTLAEMCLLAHPFPAPQSLSAIMHDTLDETRRPRIALARPDLPAELEAVVIRALRVRPEERHANARELLLDLRSALKTSPETAPLARPMMQMRASTPTPAPMTQPPVTAPPVTPIMTAPTAAIVTSAAPLDSSRRSSTLPWALAGIFLVIAAAAIVAGVFAALRLAQPKASPTEETAPP
jgi:eukaryotic-like serine/threonine-protein kinase